MRVHSGRLPGYVSDRSVATVARYPTSFCKIWYVRLVWALCSCRWKRAPHVVFFVPVVSGASVRSLFSISPMSRKPRVKSWLIRVLFGCSLTHPLIFFQNLFCLMQVLQAQQANPLLLLLMSLISLQILLTFSKMLLFPIFQILLLHPTFLNFVVLPG